MVRNKKKSGRSSIPPSQHLRRSSSKPGIKRDRTVHVETSHEQSNGLVEKPLQTDPIPSSASFIDGDRIPIRKSERMDTLEIQSPARLSQERLSLTDHKPTDNGQTAEDSVTADFFSRASVPESEWERCNKYWSSRPEKLAKSRRPRVGNLSRFIVPSVVLIALLSGYMYYEFRTEHSGKSAQKVKQRELLNKSIRNENPSIEKGSLTQDERSSIIDNIQKPTNHVSIDTVQEEYEIKTNNHYTPTKGTEKADLEAPSIEESGLSSWKHRTNPHSDDAHLKESIPLANIRKVRREPSKPVIAAEEECCSSIEEYQRALELNPNDTEILGKLAYFYLNKGKNLEAKRFAERTIRIDPKSSTGWIVLGAALDALKEPKGAKRAYRRCAEESVGKYVQECRNLIH